MTGLAEKIANLSPQQRAALEQRVRERGTARHEPIAIVGMGCRLPGGIASPAQLWQALLTGTDGISEVPADRWPNAALYDPDPDAPGKVSSRFGGFLTDIDRFDAAFFAISPREAARMDPQQRLLLEVSWNAFEDAGCSRGRLQRSNTGVFVGAHSQSSDYLLLQYEQPDDIDAFTGTGGAHNLFAGRIAYAFDLHGPALVVDTACSSSLVATHLAVQSLRAGECDLALAAGVNVILAPHFSIAASRMRMLAPDGRCKAFDHRADGFVRSEGCGAVVLKRLADARADGDRVIAVILGSATNQDGRTNGITAPNGRAQRLVLERALADAGVEVGDIGYVEAHGTGTALGDPIEVEGLAATVGRPRPDGAPVRIGALKSNLGHLEGAAGIAGLIKTALVVERGVVPANLHMQKLNPLIDVAGTRLEFPTQPTRWDTGGPRRAGISSFGWSGTNAHLVLGEMPGEEALVAANEGPLVLPLSAASPQSLLALRDSWATRLAEPGAPARHLCFTAATRREHQACRLAVTGRDAGELQAALTVANLSPAAPAAPRVVFVFPGQGAQWLGMGRELLRTQPVFRQALAEWDACAAGEAGFSVVAELAATAERSRLAEINVVQPVLVAVEIALARLWRSWGIEPVAVVGHSMGEVAAAHVAGILTLADTAGLIVRRSRSLRKIAGRGAMALVELSVDEARRLLAGREQRLSIAVVNGPRATVLSGDAAALDELLMELGARGVFCRPINVDVASHSPQVDPLEQEVRAAAALLRPVPGAVAFFSTVAGELLPAAALDASYWWRNLRQPVRFHDAVTSLLAAGHDAFVEMSPHPLLVASLGDAITEHGADAVGIGSLRRDADENAALAAGLATLYQRGATIDWPAVFGTAGRIVELPAYPWRGEHLWLDRPRGTWPGTRLAPLPGATDVGAWLHEPRWQESTLPAAAVPRPGGKWLVLGDASGVGTRVAAALLQRRQEAVIVPRAADTVASVRDSMAAHPDAIRIVHLWNLDSDAPAADPPVIDDDQLSGCGTVVALAQAIARLDLPQPPRLHIVTRGAQMLRPAGTALAQTPVWGLGRVLAEEHPEIWGGLVDLDAEASLDEQAASLVNELLGGGECEDHVAFQEGRRFVLRLTRLEARPGTFACRDDAAYFISGGLGGVGLATAEFLVERGARRLVLAGRTALPPRSASPGAVEPLVAARVAAVARLEARGVAVETPALDVADGAAVAGFVEARRAQGLAPIRGVVHAAAVTDDRLIDNLDPAGLQPVLRPKIAGALNLDRLLDPQTRDFTVFYSSLGSLLGQPGQASYAAANAFLDALAFECRRQGRHGLTVNWGGWLDLGLAQTTGARRTIDELGRRGIGAFAAKDGIAALARLLEGDAVQAAVAPIDWRRFREAASSTRLPSLAGAPIPAVVVAAPSAAAILKDLPDDQRQPRLRALLQHELAKVLRLSAAAIDVDRPMGSVGLESLTALELRRRLERELGLRLSATVMWNYPTVTALARHLGERLGLDAAATAPAPAAPSQPMVPSAVVPVASDADVVRALRARRGGGPA